MPHQMTREGPLFYARRGSGSPVLVCLHGAGGTHQHWLFQLYALSSSTRVLAVDLPGHGHSPGPGRSSIADYSAVLLALLDALELEQVVLAGHSMGGAIALWTALQAPQRVAGLVLAGTGARLAVAPVFLEALEQRPAEAVSMVVEACYAPDSSPELRAAGERGFAQVAPHVFRNDLLACHAFDVRPQVGSIACSALVLCGEADCMTPPKFSHYLHQHLPDAHLVMVPDAAHMLLVEQPRQVNAAMTDWLTSRYKSG